MTQPSSLRGLHLFVGATGLIAFALQGQLMVHVIGVQTLPDGERMMYRTSHLYLMLVCVINIVWAASYRSTENQSQWQSLVQLLISLVFLVAPLLVGASFFFESSDSQLERPIAEYTLFAIFGSGVVMVLIELKQRLLR
ncbi:MAG: hypothetical protein AB8B48_04675 [Pseudomonadales bacterium]